MPKTLYAQNIILTQGKKFTYLSEDANTAASAIAVQSTIGFHSLTTSSGQIVCIGEIGDERTEVLRTSQNTAPGGVSVTLRDSLQFTHPQDTKVYIIDYNRIEFTSATTATGTKSTLSAYPSPIQADQKETIFYDTTITSGFYFSRYNNTIEAVNSDYSDPIPFIGFADNTVFAIKKRVLENTETEIGELITHDFLDDALWEARREFHQSPGKRPFRRRFNRDIGDALTGSFRIELPLDVEKPYTAENVFGVRIGANANMDYYDKKEWDFDWVNKPRTFLTTAYGTSDKDVYVSNARDFDGSGVISIEGTNIGYSAKSNTGGTFRISTQGSWAASVGSDVYQRVTYGLPDKFTVWADVGGSAYIYFNRAIDTAYTGQNIWADYYRTVVDKDSDADELDEPRPDMFVPYLEFKIKQRKARGNLPLTDPSYQEWIIRKSGALGSEYLGTDIRIAPNIDHLL